MHIAALEALLGVHRQAGRTAMSKSTKIDVNQTIASHSSYRIIKNYSALDAEEQSKSGGAGQLTWLSGATERRSNA